jgi:hypothetical protein
MSGAPVCGRASIEDFRDKAELNGLCRRQVAVRLRPSRATLFPDAARERPEPVRASRL